MSSYQNVFEDWEGESVCITIRFPTILIKTRCDDMYLQPQFRESTGILRASLAVILVGIKNNWFIERP